MGSEEALKNILVRERAARKAAERIIEQKSRELFTLNQQLLELNRNLELQIEERTRELTRKSRELRGAKETAEKAMAIKSEFLSGISYELRTPLNIISVYTELLAIKCREEGSGEYLAGIKENADKMLAKVNGLLDVSRIENKRFMILSEPLSVKSMLEEVNSEFERRAKSEDIDFIVLHDEEIPAELIGDRPKLKQVLNSLAENALRFTKRGFIKITSKLESRNGTIANIRIDVRDTGTGFSQKHMDTIFRSPEHATDGKPEGVAIPGLSVAARIIELHGGQIKAESTPGRGSLLSFTIPFAIGDNQGSEINSITALNPGIFRERTFLIVDDFRLNQIMLSKMIEDWGATYHIANNGFEAIKILKTHNVDLVLIDLNMPGMDGYVTAGEIRNNLRMKVPVVAFISNSQIQTKVNALRAGVNGFVSKPVIPRLLLEEINLHLK
jgi:signal transduction histidine kinase/CheY-like chemotaxis protein